MAEYNYRIVNVFAEERLAGNPLAVFKDARGMYGGTMQALALQFNQSETKYSLASERATARVRVFTQSGEIRFAGHLSLGSAYVARAINQCANALGVDEAGTISVAGRVIELGRGTMSI
jgi:trans-2,3-dihydro-3-hydroxyanthranilate isomerase